MNDTREEFDYDINEKLPNDGIDINDPAWILLHNTVGRISIDPQYLLAFGIAYNAHDKQFRRDNVTPYINHPVEVSRRLIKYDYKRLAGAMLHDVLEDNHLYTAQMLLDKGIEPEIVEAVVVLTKVKGEDYFKDYLPRVKANPIAKDIKIADILSNLSDDPTDKQLWKYINALVYLLKRDSRFTILNKTASEFTDGLINYQNRQPQQIQQNEYNSTISQSLVRRVDGGNA